jgi:ABC-type transport system involved in multi-copper enzyme maturation permease subunit
MPRALLLILATGVVLLYGLYWFTIETQAETSTERGLARIGAAPDFGLAFVSQLGTILAVIMGSSLIGTEFGWGTFRTLLARVPTRSALLAAKLVALLLFVGLVVVLGYAVALGTSALVTVFADLDRGTGTNFLGHSLASVARAAYVMLPYATLAFLVALWFRSNAAGIGVGLAVYFLENLIVEIAGDALGWIPKTLPGPNADAILDLNDVGARIAPPPDVPSAWQAAGVLGLYVTAFLALSFWIFRRRDVTSG